MKPSRGDGLQRLIGYYRWEFLRRNVEFHRDFDVFCSQFADWFESRGWWYDPDVRYTRAEKDYIHRNIAPAARKLQMRWNIGRLFPYDWKFEKSGRFEIRAGVFVDLLGNSSSSPFPNWEKRLGDVTRLTVDDLLFEYERRTGLVVHDSVEEMPLPEDFQYEPEFVPEEHWDRQVYMAVDISFPLRSLVAKLEAEIQQAKREYRAKHGKLKRQELRARRRFEDFDSYLRVWDLKKQGLTYRQVARQAFPREYADDRAKDHYRRAKELIEGGYREIE